METKNLLLTIIEKLMNELAGIWIDALGFNLKTKMMITQDLTNMAPGVIWKWDQHKVVVIDFKGTAPETTGAVLS